MQSGSHGCGISLGKPTVGPCVCFRVCRNTAQMVYYIFLVTAPWPSYKGAICTHPAEKSWPPLLSQQGRASLGLCWGSSHSAVESPVPSRLCELSRGAWTLHLVINNHMWSDEFWVHRIVCSLRGALIQRKAQWYPISYIKCSQTYHGLVKVVSLDCETAQVWPSPIFNSSRYRAFPRCLHGVIRRSQAGYKGPFVSLHSSSNLSGSSAPLPC